MLAKLDKEHFYLDNELVDLPTLEYGARQVKSMWHGHEMMVSLLYLKSVARDLMEGKEANERVVRGSLKRYEDHRKKAAQAEVEFK